MFLKQVLSSYLLRSGLRSSIQSPRRSGTPKTLWYIYQGSVITSVTSFHIACSCKYCFLLYLLGWGLISKCQSSRMPRATINSACVTNTSVYQENTSVSQESSSSDLEMEVQSPSFQSFTSQVQFVPPMFIPYIEGPKMDWTVNDGLYHRCLKWKLKCENTLDCELALLPESKKCKKS